MPEKEPRALVAYFERGAENSSTARAARRIADKTHAPLFALEMSEPYPSDYKEAMARSREDLQSGARPALKYFPASLDNVDTIYLGFPNYWGTMPMAVLTFLEHFDFTGKTIRPFCTHDGGGLGHSESDIRRACPGASVTPGLALEGDNIDADAIEAWLAG